jgi:hypothetical protein
MKKNDVTSRNKHLSVKCAIKETNETAIKEDLFVGTVVLQYVDEQTMFLGTVL